MTNPTADAAKLLPCPFCGNIKPVWDLPDGDNERIYVVCGNRECTGMTYAYDKETAVKMWNTRPQPAPPEGEPDYEAIGHMIAEHCADDGLYDTRGEWFKSKVELARAIVKLLGLACFWLLLVAIMS